MTEQTPDSDADLDAEDDLSDLRPRTFWEKHGFKVLLASFATVCFGLGLMFGR